MVAVPLSMALAIATGVPPQHGLYTAIVGGTFIAALGGSRVQVSGPTAAFVVVLAPITTHYGVGGLCIATLMAGALLVLMGTARLGQWIDFVPYPVTTGFTAGIAVVIGTLQIKDLLGLKTGPLPEHYLDRVTVIAHALPSASWGDVAIGLLTLAMLIAWRRVRTRVPGALVALLVASLAAHLMAASVADFEVATIATRFTYTIDGLVHPGIPSRPPHLAWPWQLPGPDGQPLHLTFGLIRDLLPAAFAIATLGAIESLLSAVVADGMTGHRHEPDAELIAQGAGNLVVPFFGGFAATGAIARTAMNVRSGARSPIASIVHALFVLATVLVLAPALGQVPMAALAALLLLVAWNMSDAPHFLRMLRTSARADVAVLLVCFGLTIVFDMVVAVTAGVLMSAILFMKHMSELSGVRPFGEGEAHPDLTTPLPRGVVLYEIAGPLLRGRAEGGERPAQGRGPRGARGDPRPRARAGGGRDRAPASAGLRAPAELRPDQGRVRARAAPAPARVRPRRLAQSPRPAPDLPLVRARSGGGAADRRDRAASRRAGLTRSLHSTGGTSATRTQLNGARDPSVPPDPFVLLTPGL
jgi:SulP family sulfate permease